MLYKKGTLRWPEERVLKVELLDYPVLEEGSLGVKRCQASLIKGGEMSYGLPLKV